MLTEIRRKRLTPARRHLRGAVRIATFWAHARWATPPGMLTDFSFSSVLWEQYFDAAGKRHRLYLGLVSSSRASILSSSSISAGAGPVFDVSENGSAEGGGLTYS